MLRSSWHGIAWDNPKWQQLYKIKIVYKQTWSLIHSTHSLFYRVYKSRHFPNCSFMDAELGNNPSYVRRSLLAARDIITKGSLWRVGDGRYIEVLTHKWLSHKPIFLGENQPSLHVSDLIDGITMQWDREKVFDLFANQTQMEILAIPLSWTNLGDTLVWKENFANIFTMKTTY